MGIISTIKQYLYHPCLYEKIKLSFETCHAQGWTQNDYLKNYQLAIINGYILVHVDIVNHFSGLYVIFTKKKHIHA